MRGYRHSLVLAVCVAGLAAPVARAVDQKEIDRAVASGVKFLRSLQQRDGSWPYPKESGATSLAALTLLECDVPANDPAIEKAAEFVRQASYGMTQNYSISLAIMFLDRLGDPADIPLLESLMIRLMAGQNPDGGWGYNCPPISEEEVTRLRDLMGKRNELRGQLSFPKFGAKKRLADLPKEIQQQAILVHRGGGGGGGGGGGVPMGPGVPTMTDNSNTQFATLAMWIGRKHGLPVDNALLRIDRRFRMTQYPEGTWGYIQVQGLLGSTPTPLIGGGGGGPPLPDGRTVSTQMTCAGVLGLTVAHGVANDPEQRGRTDPKQDRSLQKGLAALAGAIGEPGNPPKLGEGQGKAYYCLWSLERVCVALDLDRLGNKDWYSWGAEILLTNQDGTGAWRGEYADSGVDTCFSLLFLRRANLARDLTANLKGKLQRVELRTGLGKIKALDKEKKVEDTRPKDTPVRKPISSRVENTEAEQLSKELLQAKDSEREKVLGKLRDTRGGDYTEALALAIPRLNGETRQQARDALQERMIRLSARQLSKYMEDGDSEIRAAAILGSARKGVREHIPLIIARLNDNDPYVTAVSQVALKVLTKEDFGPKSGASREEHEKAVADWTAWWKKNSSN